MFEVAYVNRDDISDLKDILNDLKNEDEDYDDG